MSTITRELAKLFRKITNSEIDAEGNAHVVLSPADSLLINNARIALASLEAEPVAYIFKHPAGRLFWSLTDESNKGQSDVMPVYTAPPAPVALPSGYSDFEEIWSSSTHPLTQDDEMKDFAWDIWNACRAAMLQGAEPVKNHDELREKVRREHAEWSQATFGDVGPVGPLKHLSKEALEAAAEPRDLSEWADMQFLLWDAQRRAGISDGEITAAMEEKLKVNMARQWPEPKDGEPRLHIKAAPQQEVTQALAKGMERYGDAMQKLADSGD